MSDRLLNAKEAGALLNVPHTWVLAEARSDRIPHVRLGRYVRFNRATCSRGPTHGSADPSAVSSNLHGRPAYIE